MLRFTRTLSVKHHPTGDHYSVSIPREIAQALGLQDDGGLVSIELSNQESPVVILKAYQDSLPVTRLVFNPADASLVNVPFSPSTRGRSRTCPEGMDISTKPWQALRQARLQLAADMKRMRSSQKAGNLRGVLS